jgi:hypothetical protein
VLEADVVAATLIRMASSASRGVHGLGISARAPPRAGRCRNGLPLTKVARKAQALPNFVGNGQYLLATPGGHSNPLRRDSTTMRVGAILEPKAILSPAITMTLGLSRTWLPADLQNDFD